MIGGIVLFAYGLEVTLHHVGDPLRGLPAAALAGGVAIYPLAPAPRRHPGRSCW